MVGTQQLNVTLPDDIAQMIKAKVLSGEYANESEVICESLATLKSRDDAFEAWLITKAAPAYDKLKADSDRALSLDHVRQHLTNKRR